MVQKLTEGMQRVIQAVESSPYPLTPYQIAMKANLKYSSAKVFCHLLSKLGKLKRLKRGYYTKASLQVNESAKG